MKAGSQAHPADVSYVPGVLTAVAGDQAWALIEAAPDSPAVTKVWRQLRQGAAADTLLAGLLADGSGGAPGFALLTPGNGGQHRLFCHGTVSATLITGVAARETPSGAPAGGEGQPARERVDGTGLLTWREHVVVHAERVFLGEPPAETALRLPATSGVILASCMIVDFASLAARETVAEEPVRPAKQATAVPYPDTITITHPGGGTGHPAGAGDAGVAQPAQSWQAPSIPGRPGLIDVPPWLSDPGASDATVNRADLPELIDRAAPPDRIGPLVPALICPAGHVSPPTGTFCGRCGAPLPHDPMPVPRPVLGVLRLSLGDVITLDRGVLMGRNPRTDFGDADGGERPHVVKLPSADGDISRTHLQVTLDGWHVLVTDMGSTNGTLVTLPGRDPQQLRPGEPMLIQPGTLVVLADGIDFRYEAAE